MLKKTLSLFAAFVCVMGSLQADEKANYVLDKHIEHLGGKDRIENLETLDMVMVMSMPGAGMTITSDMKIKKGGMLLMEQTLPNGMEMKQVFNQGDGYILDFTGKRPLSPEEVETLSEDADLQGPLKYLEQYQSITFKERKDLDDVAVDVLSFINEDGDEELWYFDDEGALVRKDHKLPMGQMGEMYGTEVYKNYAEVKGYRFPMMIEFDLGAMGFTMEIESVQVNEEMDDSLFALESE